MKLAIRLPGKFLRNYLPIRNIPSERPDFAGAGNFVNS
jgi:hypothetical protein